jgi:hypothetical protein
MPVNPAKYLALTIAGAVSLGSYEAGAMYEMLDALRQHNEKVKADGDGTAVYVDVITGASAGGMTGTILAQKLLFDGPAFVDAGGKSSPYDNPLYNCWVKRISLEELLTAVDGPLPGGDPPTLSLLSSQLIERIAAETLTDAAVDGVVPDLGAHAVVDDTHGIQLGLALTNLNGVNYGVTMSDGTQFKYTEYSDQMLRPLDRASRTEATWAELREACVACGAFPVAFRTKDLTRARADYEASDTLDAWPADPYTFTYTDGGVLQNQPLGMAKNLVDEVDNHQGEDRRFYLFVSPNPVDGSQDLDLTEANANILKVGERLIAVYMGQAMFRDWIAADAVNLQVAALDERAVRLAQALAAGKVDAGALATASGQILDLLYANGEGGGASKERVGKVSVAESREAANARLTTQYAAELAMLGGAGVPAGAAFLNGIQALEKAANLGSRDMMRLYSLVIDPKLLAGAGISAFVGFFDERFRQHDYERGRAETQKLLAQINQATDPGLGPIYYTPAAVTVDTTLDGLHLKAIDRGDVKTLKKGLTNRVNQILKAIAPNEAVYVAERLIADPALGLLLDWEFSRDVQG